MQATSDESARERPVAAAPDAARAPARLVDDYQTIARIYGDPRSPERIIAHFELERRLAAGLRTAAKSERESGLCTQLYDALLGELDDHPRKRPVTLKGQRRRENYVRRQVRMIRNRTGPNDVFLEMGGGDCEVALRVSPHVRQSIVIDVTDELVPPDAAAPNFQFIKTATIAAPLPDASIDFIYSNQVMEHLHPEDAIEQVRELVRVLKPGGRYLCRTPSRITGPHDVSRYFEPVALGTHMQEYTYRELTAILTDAGFADVRVLLAPRAYDLFALPRSFAFAMEDVLARVPRRSHTRICRSRIVRALLGVTMIARKPL